MVEFDENLNPIEDNNSGGQNNNPAQPEPGQPAMPNWTQAQTPKVEPFQAGATRPETTYTQPPIQQPVQQPTRQPHAGMSGAILTLLVIVFVGLMAITITAMTTGGQGSSVDNYADGITVSGDGVVYATPDIAELNFGVFETAKTVEDVTDKVDGSIEKVIEALDEFDIDDEDIKTVDFNLYPESDYRYSPARITGYTSHHSFALTIRNLDDVNDIVDAVTKAGANEVGNITFTVEDPQEWIDNARDDAIKEAKDKAKAIAKSADTKLGKLLSIQENIGNPYEPMYDYGMGGGMMEKAPNIESGSQEIRVNVTLRYQLG
jgi:hypothetical protein